jgi:hypothetical protein
VLYFPDCRVASHPIVLRDQAATTRAVDYVETDYSKMYCDQNSLETINGWFHAIAISRDVTASPGRNDKIIQPC